MKKKIFAIAAIVICLALAAGGTLAYYTAEQVTHNVITTGNVSAQILEQREVPAEDGTTRLEPYPADKPIRVMPGTSQSKIVCVENTGKGDAWVRVRLGLTITDADGEPLPIRMEQKEGDSLALVMLDIDTDQWLLADGYFYFRQPLQAGKQTPALFHHVYFSPEMDNTYQDSTFVVTVEMQAVQTANNPVPAGGTAANVQGWPA